MEGGLEVGRIEDKFLHFYGGVKGMKKSPRYYWNSIQFYENFYENFNKYYTNLRANLILKHLKGKILRKKNRKSSTKTLTYDSKILKLQQWVQNNYDLKASFEKKIYSEFFEHIWEITTSEQSLKWLTWIFYQF